jgi:hypothetical protein
MRFRLISDIRRALKHVENARSKNWIGFEGESLEPKLIRVEEILRQALGAVSHGDPVDYREVIGISRWIADWIPDIDDPLLDAAYAVEERAARLRQNQHNADSVRDREVDPNMDA